MIVELSTQVALSWHSSSHVRARAFACARHTLTPGPLMMHAEMLMESTLENDCKSIQVLQMLKSPLIDVLFCLNHLL